MRPLESKRANATNLLAVLLFSLVTAGCAAFPQTQDSESLRASSPVFEVASIKLNTSGSGASRSSSDPGSYFGTNGRLKDLIKEAYSMNGERLEDSQILNCPAWAAAKRYDVDAKTDALTRDAIKKLSETEQRNAMNRALQSLLADRFKLKVTEATKEIAVYALVVAKSGPKLKKEPPDGPGGQHANRTSHGLAAQGLDGLAKELARMPIFSDRPVVNQTGLTDRYDIVLSFSPSAYSGHASDLADSSGDAPSIFTALEEQLGLRIESTKAPVYTITVDRLEEPSAN